MKRVVKWSFITIGILFLISIVTCPDENDYRRWLSEKHSISCTNNGLENTCKKHNEIIEWKSKHIRSALIYLKVEDNYVESNTIYEVKVLGIFGRFIDFTNDNIYD
ncbi:hypothetical protein EBB07_13210 [Paenibacillaceae bacterium]|nr:hypothetical protein EBB07_13210 [Paenibacillaceae bacterium]